MQCTFLQSTIYSELGKYLFHGPFQIKKILKAVAFFAKRIMKSKNFLVEYCIVCEKYKRSFTGNKREYGNTFH